MRLPTGLRTEFPSVVKMRLDPLEDDERIDMPVAAGVP